MKTGLVPGKIINGKLIRRGTWWPNIAQAVSTQTKYPEAAYLTLQWGNSAQMFGWMVGNPAGFYVPVPDDGLDGPDRGRQLPSVPGGTSPRSGPRPKHCGAAASAMSGNSEYVAGAGRQPAGGDDTGSKTAVAGRWPTSSRRVGGDHRPPGPRQADPGAPERSRLVVGGDGHPDDPELIVDFRPRTTRRGGSAALAPAQTAGCECRAVRSKCRPVRHEHLGADG